MGPPSHCYACAGLGWIFGDIGVDLRASDIVKSWPRLKPPVEYISYPYWMYTKCFITVICYGCAYGSTLTMLCLCRMGVDFREIGVDLSLTDVAMS
jgi:hypothetical protein